MTAKHTKVLQEQYDVKTEVSERKVGLIMGLSPESSEVYYRDINRSLSALLGGLHSAHLLAESFNFAEIDALMRLGDSGWREIAVQMDNAVRTFKSAGAKAIAVCSNTMHRAVTPVCENLGLPLIHIGDAVALAMQQNESQRVALLGTTETMTGDFLVDRLCRLGTEIIVPDERYHAEINRIIFEELCKGDCDCCESREFLYTVIAELKAKYKIDGVILGCTELPLLLSDAYQSIISQQYRADGPFTFYDSTRIHINAIVSYCCTGRLPLG